MKVKILRRTARGNALVEVQPKVLNTWGSILAQQFRDTHGLRFARQRGLANGRGDLTVHFQSVGSLSGGSQLEKLVDVDEWSPDSPSLSWYIHSSVAIFFVPSTEAITRSLAPAPGKRTIATLCSSSSRLRSWNMEDGQRMETPGKRRVIRSSSAAWVTRGPMTQKRFMEAVPMLPTWAGPVLRPTVAWSIVEFLENSFTTWRAAPRFMCPAQ